MSSENAKLGFKMEGFVTNANYSVKKLQFLLFINRTLPHLIPRLKHGVEEGLGIRITLTACDLLSTIGIQVVSVSFHRPFGWQHCTSQRSWNSLCSLPPKEHSPFHLHEVNLEKLWTFVECMTYFFLMQHWDSTIKRRRQCPPYQTWGKMSS